MTLHNTKYRFLCAECGAEFGSNRPHAEFCGTSCRKTFNNRRAQRGAELYDFAMLRRFGDKNAKNSREYATEMLALMDALVSGYHEADKRYRDGRRSYATLKAAKAQLNRLPGTPDKR